MCPSLEKKIKRLSHASRATSDEFQEDTDEEAVGRWTWSDAFS